MYRTSNDQTSNELNRACRSIRREWTSEEHQRRREIAALQQFQLLQTLFGEPRKPR